MQKLVLALAVAIFAVCAPALAATRGDAPGLCFKPQTAPDFDVGAFLGVWCVRRGAHGCSRSC